MTSLKERIAQFFLSYNSAKDMNGKVRTDHPGLITQNEERAFEIMTKQQEIIQIQENALRKLKPEGRDFNCSCCGANFPTMRKIAEEALDKTKKLMES